MINKVILMGRLTKDPEIRYTPSGAMTASFTLAIDGKRKSENGEKQTDFINCVAWEKRAEFMRDYFSKGMMAIVEGRIQTRSWTDSKDGKKRYATDILRIDIPAPTVGRNLMTMGMCRFNGTP